MHHANRQDIARSGNNVDGVVESTSHLDNSSSYRSDSWSLFVSLQIGGIATCHKCTVVDTMAARRANTWVDLGTSLIKGVFFVEASSQQAVLFNIYIHIFAGS